MEAAVGVAGRMSRVRRRLSRRASAPLRGRRRRASLLRHVRPGTTFTGQAVRACAGPKRL